MWAAYGLVAPVAAGEAAGGGAGGDADLERVETYPPTSDDSNRQSCAARRQDRCGSHAQPARPSSCTRRPAHSWVAMGEPGSGPIEACELWLGAVLENCDVMRSRPVFYQVRAAKSALCSTAICRVGTSANSREEARRCRSTRFRWRVPPARPASRPQAHRKACDTGRRAASDTARDVPRRIGLPTIASRHISRRRRGSHAGDLASRAGGNPPAKRVERHACLLASLLRFQTRDRCTMADFAA